MTEEQKIKKLEDEIWFIFNKDYIPRFLAVKGAKLINKWITLTEWEEDPTPFLQEPILEEPNETKRH
jgi:hypothetical protein